MCEAFVELNNGGERLWLQNVRRQLLQFLATGKKGHSELLKAIPKYQMEEEEEEEEVRLPLFLSF